MSIGADSDYRLRGYSLTDRHPAATAQVAYDHPSGAYMGLLAIGSIVHEDPQLIGVQANVGFARRVTPVAIVDVGLTRFQYESPVGRRRSYHYTEAYLGLTVNRFTWRVAYSPDYFHHDASTLYGEAEVVLEPSPKWRVNAHVGGLVYLRAPYERTRDARYDWRLGASRLLGNLEVHAALSGGGPGKDFYGHRPRSKTAFTVGASWGF